MILDGQEVILDEHGRLLDTSPIVGYFDWRDTVCIGCVEAYHINVSLWSELTENNTKDDGGFTCVYCGCDF